MAFDIILGDTAPSTDWAPPPSKQCKHGKAAANSSVFVCEKTEKLDINPSAQNQAVPEQLLYVRWPVVLQILPTLSWLEA